MNTVEALAICSAALTRSGHNPITDFEDGSEEAVIAAANYEEVVREELSKVPWSRAKKDVELNRLNQDTINGWDYVFQVPHDCLELVSVHVDGRPVDYERKEDKIYCDEEEATGNYIVRADESIWPGDFRGAIITRMESIFLRGLADKDEEAELQDGRADTKFKLAASKDAKNRTPKDRRGSSRLVAVRRGG